LEEEGEEKKIKVTKRGMVKVLTAISKSNI